jgi:prolyl-tRNA editing enzyme YbaK/EbsC (Cys-tRNA(Pro) deacylase)
VHRNAAAIVDAAARLGLTIEPVEFPEGTRTAEDAARAIGVAVAQIVKSLVFLSQAAPDTIPARRAGAHSVGFMAGPDVVLALVSGANRLDERRLAALAGVDGDRPLGRADADQVRAATGFPIGGVPPFGHPRSLPTFVDEDLLAHDVVWAAAGTPRHVFAIAPVQLVQLTAGHVAPLANVGG